ncbi:MAG: HAD-IIA family hydrolase [Planctomycetota bacterium]
MKVNGWLLDVEGVLVGDKRYLAVPGAVEFIRRVRAAGCPLRLITNNTTDDRPTLVEKLTNAGFDFTINELHTCIAAASAHLQAHNVQRCLVLGNAALQRMFAEAGFEVVEESQVDAVVVGLDTELTYERLLLATDALVRHSAVFIALHQNRLSVESAGRTAPSVGSIVAALEYATQVAPTVMGKPSSTYFQQVLDDLNVPPADVMVVSDDPLTDLAGAKRLGLQTAFVLSGKYKDTAVLSGLSEEEQPDITTARISDLLDEDLVEL